MKKLILFCVLSLSLCASVPAIAEQPDAVSVQKLDEFTAWSFAGAFNPFPAALAEETAGESFAIPAPPDTVVDATPFLPPKVAAWLATWGVLLVLVMQFGEKLARMTKTKADDAVIGWVHWLAKCIGLYHDPTDKPKT